jgi:hypothetical protein
MTEFLQPRQEFLGFSFLTLLSSQGALTQKGLETFIHDDVKLPPSSLSSMYGSKRHSLNPFALNIDMVSPISFSLAVHNHNTARIQAQVMQEICNHRSREIVR